MAIFHFSASTGSRAGGQSASAKHDYITRDGRYTYRKDSDPCLYEAAGNMPSWAGQDAGIYWKAADDHERANGRLFKHLEIALLDELNLEQNKTLIARFVQEITSTPDGVAPFEYAIHAGKVGKGHPENLHAHVMISERILDGIDRTPETWFRRAATKDQDSSQYGARKTLNFKPEQWLLDARRRWAEVANEALEASGHSVRIDHRTLDEQKYEALELGLFDRALELNRAPKRYTPRAAYQYEMATEQDSSWRKENEEFLAAREEKEAIAREKFAQLVENMRAAKNNLEDAQAEPEPIAKPIPTIVDPVIVVPPLKPLKVFEESAPSTESTPATMADRMTAFFSDAVEKVIGKAKALSKSMTWAKKAVFALFDEVPAGPANHTPKQTGHVAKANPVEVKRVEDLKPEPAKETPKPIPKTTVPLQKMKVEPAEDTQQTKPEPVPVVQKPEPAKVEPSAKDIQPVPNQVEKIKPAQATEEAEVQGVPKVKKPRNSAPRKRQAKADAPVPELTKETQEEETARMVAKLKSDVYQRAMRAIEESEQPEPPSKPKAQRRRRGPRM